MHECFALILLSYHTFTIHAQNLQHAHVVSTSASTRVANKNRINDKYLLNPLSSCAEIRAIAMRVREKTRALAKTRAIVVAGKCVDFYTLRDNENVYSVRRGSVLQNKAELACTEGYSGGNGQPLSGAQARRVGV